MGPVLSNDANSGTSRQEEGTMGKFVKVATKSEISDQSAKLLKIGDKRIALFNLGGQFFAIDDTCPHADGPLSEGSIEGEEVECPGTVRGSTSKQAT